MSDDSKDVKPAGDESKDENAEDSRDEQETKEQDESDLKSENEQEDGEDKSAADDDDEKEENESEEESEDEPQVGLLEKPLVLEEGRKRERKKVERISFEAAGGGPVHVFEIKEGKGRALGDIPYIDFRLSRTKAEELKPLYRILFRKPGSVHEVKKHIRQFSGFPFPPDDTEVEKRMTILKGKSFTLPILKKIMEILDIPRSGTKDELATRLMEWLQKPEDSGKKVPEPKRKRKNTSAKKGKTEKKKKKTEKKKKVTKKKESSDVEEESEEEEEEEEKDEEEMEEEEKEAEESEVSSEDEEEEEPPKKKARKSTPKAPKEKKPKEKKTPSKPVVKKKATPQKKEVVSSDNDSDSEDEPLATKVQEKGPPTNDELKDVVKKMLDNANLEQVTMKTVLKDVFAKYPDFDLTDRKDFIKNTVKQIIS